VFFLLNFLVIFDYCALFWNTWFWGTNWWGNGHIRVSGAKAKVTA